MAPGRGGRECRVYRSRCRRGVPREGRPRSNSCLDLRLALCRWTKEIGDGQEVNLDIQRIAGRGLASDGTDLNPRVWRLAFPRSARVPGCDVRRLARRRCAPALQGGLAERGLSTINCLPNCQLRPAAAETLFDRRRLTLLSLIPNGS